MEREQIVSQYSTDNVMDMIYLIRCAISRTRPDIRRVALMDQQKLYAIAARHSLAALVGSVLEGTDTGEMGKRWKTTFSMAVRKLCSLTQSAESSCPLWKRMGSGIWL